MQTTLRGMVSLEHRSPKYLVINAIVLKRKDTYTVPWTALGYHENNLPPVMPECTLLIRGARLSKQPPSPSHRS